MSRQQLDILKLLIPSKINFKHSKIIFPISSKSRFRYSQISNGK